jgi:hypothetical protein
MTILTTIRSKEPLSDDQIFRVAPSVFAEDKHASRSQRYTYLPTIDALRALRREGFEAFAVQQSRTRDESKRGHAKHLIRMRHADAFNRDRGETVNEVVLINSHDGSSAWEMMAGCFRIVCTNGLVTPTSLIDSVKVRHSGNVIAEIQEGAYRILSGFERVEASRDAMRALPLSQPEREAFAASAIALRYPDAPHMPLRAEQVLQPRRFEDRSSDLWATFNTVQEHLIRGGLDMAQAVETEGGPQLRRRQRTRGVMGIDNNTNLNRAMWMLAERMRELRGEATQA